IPNIQIGGAERFVVDLSNELVTEHEVILILFYDNTDVGNFKSLLNKNINVIFLDKKRGFDLRVIKRLYEIIHNIKPDIIHSHLRAFNYLIPIISLLRKTPIIHTVHNDAYQECVNRNIRWLRRLCFKRKNIFPV